MSESAPAKKKWSLKKTCLLLALLLLGLHIKGIRAELRGFCIEYCGYTGAVGHALAALAGPAAGLAYALAASTAGELTPGE